MRKSSKVLSLVLAGAMAFSTASVSALSVSAAETDTKIYFEFPTEYWADAVPEGGLTTSVKADGTPVSTVTVFAHTWAVAGDSEYKSVSFQSRKEMCTYEGDGIYSYDPGKKLGFSMKDGADYAVIFSTLKGSGYQTCNITMGTPCYGDTVVCTGETTENTQNSQIADWRGVWKNNDNFGPKLEITSTGRVVGEIAPTSVTKEEMVATFLFDFAVKNANIIDAEDVQKVMANEFINVTAEQVYNKYVEMYAHTLEDPETYPNAASLELVAELTGYVQDTTASEPVESEPVESEPVESEPVESEPVESEPVESEPVESEPVESEPVESEPVESEPVVSEPVVVEDVYVVAGSEQLCGVNWKGNAEEAPDNVMVEADGVYTKVFTDVQPVDGLQIKVVKNNTDWIGDETGNNITFNVKTACDVTVTFDPATSKITVSGEGVEFVTELKIDAIYAVGNGEEGDAWMNGVSWNQAAEVNKMEEISEKVYQITFTDVVEFSEGYQVKFAANGTWNDSWGGVYTEGAEFDAVYNGDNLLVPVNYALADVTLTLDLTNFDYATKTGAKATITVTEKKAAILYGDVNLDGEIDVNDVTCIQMFLAKYENVIDAELGETLADVSGDGLVDVVDVTTLQKYLVGGYTNTGVAGTEYVAV